jgi:adenylate cyclase
MQENGTTERKPQPVKILVVDDEPDLESLIRMKFRRQIRAGDFEFVNAGDGEAALALLTEHPDVDIVLTDINMPRMDGLTLLARLAELESLLKAVVVTAYGDMENIRTAMNRGAFDFLTKPIDLGDLEITINKARETVSQQKRAAFARDLFGRYLSTEIAAALLEEAGALRLGGQKRRVTLLMSDVRGFSTFAERLPPERVVEILNIYLGKMADVITAYDGTIIEFIGDGILVIFGAPIQREGDARRAVACALAMQQAMEEVNADVARMGHAPLEMGIGLNTGEVVVGNIGSLKRVKYGVVGSNVNLVSRIESYTVGGQVLISESTRVEAGRDLGIGRQMEVSAKGFSEPISIYEVTAIGAPYDLALPERVEHLVRLAEPFPIRYTILDGKHMTGAVHDGVALALSSTGALVQTAGPAPLLSNLKIHLPSPQDPAEPLGDLYAKIVDVAADGQEVQIRFTAIPQDVADTLQSLSAA